MQHIVAMRHKDIHTYIHTYIYLYVHLILFINFTCKTAFVTPITNALARHGNSVGGWYVLRWWWWQWWCRWWFRYRLRMRLWAQICNSNQCGRIPSWQVKLTFQQQKQWKRGVCADNAWLTTHKHLWNYIKAISVLTYTPIHICLIKYFCLLSLQ